MLINTISVKLCDIMTTILDLRRAGSQKGTRDQIIHGQIAYAYLVPELAAALGNFDRGPGVDMSAPDSLTANLPT